MSGTSTGKLTLLRSNVEQLLLYNSIRSSQFGDRLSFLGPLKAYLSWIKKNAGHKAEVIQEYEQRERDFRSNLFYDEEVHDEVLKAFGDDFIGALVTRKRTRDEANAAPLDHADDSVFNPVDDGKEKAPSSKASSSMMSIAEEGKGGSDEYEEGMFDDAAAAEGEKKKGREEKKDSEKKKRKTRGQ